VKYRGLLHCLTTVTVEEGFLALWKGLVPGLLRQSIFATLRVGLYPHVKKFYHSGEGDPSLGTKVLSGLTSGCIGISIASPTDLVKVRLQAEGRLPPDVLRRYKGTADAFLQIYRADGITGFWRGVGPNIIRNSLINAAELVTYDQTKTIVRRNDWMKEGLACHFACALTAGFVATCVGSPADVIKTRIMNQKVQPDGTREYRSFFHALVTIPRREGFFGLYKGFLPNFARIGSWNCIMFVSFERIKTQFNTYRIPDRRTTTMARIAKDEE